MTLGERMHAAGYEVLIKNVGPGYCAYLKAGGKVEYAEHPPYIVDDQSGLHWVQV